MLKAKRILNIVFSVLFILAISLPLVFSDKRGGAFSQVENRMLASFPQIIGEDGGRAPGIISGMEDWINDNVGGRAQMSVVNTAVEYYVFGQSAKSDTLLGKDDWTYYYNDDILLDYQRKNQPTEAEIDLYVGGLSAVQAYLDAKGIPFLSFLVPDKKTVYPENYPASILQLPLPNRSDILTGAMQAAGVRFQPLLPALLLEKQTETVYSERIDNGHWNNYGAFIGYQEMVRAAQQYIEVDMLTLSDYDVTRVEQSTLFNGVIPLSELTYQFKKKTGGTAVLDNAFFDQFEGLTFAQNEGAYKLHYVNEQLGGQPSVLYIGDSYFMPMQQFFKEGARELTFLHSSDLALAQQVIDAMEPDIVIFEMVERMLPGLLRQSRAIQQEGRFEISEPVWQPGAESGYFGMWLDFANGALVTEQGALLLTSGAKEYLLDGWACDFFIGGPLAEMSVQVGDEILPCQYGNQRESVSTYFGNDNLLETGFTVYIPAEALEGVTEIAFLQTLSDGTQKEPVVYTIAWE